MKRQTWYYFSLVIPAPVFNTTVQFFVEYTFGTYPCEKPKIIANTLVPHYQVYKDDNNKFIVELNEKKDYNFLTVFKQLHKICTVQQKPVVDDPKEEESKVAPEVSEILK